MSGISLTSTENKKIEKTLITLSKKYETESRACMLMFATGLRAEEVHGAEIRHVPVDDVPVLVVAISLDPFAAPRIIPLCDYQLELLDKAGITYPGLLVGPISINRIEQFFEQMLEKAGKTSEEIKSYIVAAANSNHSDGMTAAGFVFRNNLRNIYETAGINNDDVEYLLGNENVYNISYRHSEHRVELAAKLNRAFDWQTSDK